MGALELPLLALGFTIGGVVYLGLAIAFARAAHRASRAMLALYWRDRGRRETADAVRRVKAVAAPPPRRSERRAA